MTEFYYEDDPTSFDYLKQLNEGEMRLYYAVLTRAVQDIIYMSKKESKGGYQESQCSSNVFGGLNATELKKLKIWFRTNSVDEMSFLWICETLEIDPRDFLIKLNTLVEEKTGKREYLGNVDDIIAGKLTPKYDMPVITQHETYGTSKVSCNV